jgi:hypothetical protein
VPERKAATNAPFRLGVTGVMVRRDTKTAQPGPQTVQKPEGLRSAHR